MRELKKKKVGLEVFAILAILIIFLIVSYFSSIYTRHAEVGYVSNDLVRVIDDSGNIWEFQGEGFQPGDRIKMTMDSCGTDEKISDDLIKRVDKLN